MTARDCITSSPDAHGSQRQDRRERTLTLAALAMVACVIPARRATGPNTIEALRQLEPIDGLDGQNRGFQRVA
jgi:hypothetical protein